MIFYSKFYLFIVIINCQSIKADLGNYIRNIGSFFSFSDNKEATDIQGFDLDQKVPYEVSIPDQNFISQAIKLTGVQESELDSCQHRVVLKLRTACDKMNDEDLAKMAVALLNCQSRVEGRKIYPCSDSMSIRDCTIDMDADTWNTYHLMSNRARAVCYFVRQVQFRGITEMTVNKLMEAARNQINTLGKISKDQENLQQMAQDTLHTVSLGYKEIAEQQQDLQKAQLFGQLSIEDNIQRLSDEKRLIADSQKKLSALTKSVHEKLEKAAKQLTDQSKESKLNHQELLDDMMHIQNMAQVIFQRIEDSSKILLEQSKMAIEQYNLTLKQLAEVNSTVHTLVHLMSTTRQAIDDRLNWISSALGGTDKAVERLYTVVWHIGFLLVAMIACAFLSARYTTRLMVATIPPLNLALYLNGNENAQDPVSLGISIGALIIVQSLVLLAITLANNGLPKKVLFWKNQKQEKLLNSSPSPIKFDKEDPILQNGLYKETAQYESYRLNETAILEDDEDNIEFSSPTPPLSRNGFYSRSRSRTPLLNGSKSKPCCHAKTRIGTPCKNNPLPGRDFCFRHQTGDSVMGS